MKNHRSQASALLLPSSFGSGVDKGEREKEERLFEVPGKRCRIKRRARESDALLLLRTGKKRE